MSHELSRHEALLELFMAHATSPEHNAAKNEILNLRELVAKLEKAKPAAKKPAAPKAKK